MPSSNITPSHLTKDKDYKSWLTQLKKTFVQTRLQASVRVNQELLQFYWQLGEQIVEKQQSSTWGDGFLNQLSQDLMHEFPDIKGFSVRNLKYIRQWCVFWSASPLIGQQAVAQLCQIPWGHNIAIISKCQSDQEAHFYITNTQKQGWSRTVLIHQIESGLYQRKANAITNFEQTLPPLQSDLAKQSLKDPYVFDFLSLTDNYNERELEKGLVKHITQFLLELGAGFAYMGRQVPVNVGEKDFYLDLLFYHTQLHCYVVIELKTTEFEPEHAGKLNFYINAVDAQLKKDNDQATVGLLLCRKKDKLVAEYALKGIETPIGVSEYQLTQALPDNLKTSLPSIEVIEQELAKELGDEDEQ
ncbi:PDDEXK nuclease domain-containing protein [Marinicellulosiphila megalodicopiae]|uniref:PDDEXK nuclease domain-containing protein n=1 Tax=Marinicellulosiphila megalodicopiae TaxID=2724896 RepID=UPI003BB06940